MNIYHFQYSTSQQRIMMKRYFGSKSYHVSLKQQRHLPLPGARKRWTLGPLATKAIATFTVLATC